MALRPNLEKRLIGMSAQKERDFAEKEIKCATTSFLLVEKGRKETLRGCPPKHPGWSAGFLFRKTGGYGICLLYTSDAADE